jgi:hypothetical protein
MNKAATLLIVLTFPSTHTAMEKNQPIDNLSEEFLGQSIEGETTSYKKLLLESLMEKSLDDMYILDTKDAKKPTRSKNAKNSFFYSMRCILGIQLNTTD